jgi:hypothetical protein
VSRWRRPFRWFRAFGTFETFGSFTLVVARAGHDALPSPDAELIISTMFGDRRPSAARADEHRVADAAASGMKLKLSDSPTTAEGER